MDVLQLDASGRPQAWITPREAANLYVCEAIAWTLGEPCLVLHGGIQRRTGLQSLLVLHPIVAVRGAVPARAWRQVPALTNHKLFARDRHLCAYCGQSGHDDHLTREHIVPTSRGGGDSWMNCITACRGCNNRKGNRLLQECRMELLYLPYTPSLHEDMILKGRRIVADQMDYLLASVPRHSRLHG